jgi:predicted component of type VI protein secretion system
MPAQLISLNDGPNILLDKPILLLGRHPECDVQIDSRKISRRHCCIAQVSDYLVVRDLGSTNGVRINGNRILEGRLAPGDELTIGTYRYRVVWDSLIKSVATPPKPAKGVSLADDDLEECDDPVALPEPGLGNRPPAGPVAGPNRQTIPSEGGKVIVPEELNLLPPSGVMRRGPSQAPPV